MEMFATIGENAVGLRTFIVTLCWTLGLFLSAYGVYSLVGNRNESRLPVILAIIGGVLLSNANSIVGMTLASMLPGESPNGLLSSLPTDTSVATAMRIAFQIMTLIGWYYALSGLYIITVEAPRQRSTYGAGAMTMFLGAGMTAPAALMAMFGSSAGVNVMPLLGGGG